jgi:hypothetical protein
MQRSNLFCLLTLLCFTTFSLNAQDMDYRPNLIPPSPDASSLGKHAEAPTGLYTGTIPITVPIYTLTDGNLKVPVSLTYHAGGNKVEEAASCVGLGFSLNAGGAIMRSVRNLPDDYPVKGFLDYTLSYSLDYLKNNPARYTQWEEIAKGCADAEPDAYYFNFNGYTGSFTFDQYRNVLIVGKNAWKTEILKTDPSFPKKITGWKFTCDDGTIYTFAAAEQTTITDNGFPCQAGITYNSAWYLTNITSANGGRTVNFTYENYTQNFDVYHSVTHRIFCYPNPAGCQTTAATPTTNFTKLVYNGVRVKTITSSDNGTLVTFNYLTARTDEPGTNLKQLDEISIKNKDATELRKFSLTYDYSTGRLSLKGIKKVNTEEPPFEFSYSTTMLPPRIGNGGNPSSFGQDHWGFYNGKNDNTTLVPPIWKDTPGSTVQTFYPGGDRNPDETKMDAGILTKISYPAGSTEEYFYQANEYDHVGNQTLEDLGELMSTDQMVTYTSDVEAYGSAGNPQTSTKDITVAGNGVDDFIVLSISMHGAEPPVGDAYVEIYKFGTTTVLYHKAMTFQLGTEPVVSDFVHLPKDTKYTIKAYATGEYNHPPTGDHVDSHAYMSVTWESKVTTTSPLKRKKTGGLRIAYLKNSAYQGDPMPVFKQYSYDDGVYPNASSSGVIVETPVYDAKNLKYYAAGETACSYDLRIAQNRSILGYGPRVCYGTVTESSASNGRTVYSFDVESDAPSHTYDQAPFQLATSAFIYADGNVNHITNYSNDNKPVSETILMNSLYGGQNLEGIKINFDGGTNTASKFHGGYYNLLFGVFHPNYTTKREYSSDGLTWVETSKSASYYHQFLASESAYSSNNSSNYDRTEYFYPFDYQNPTLVVQKLMDKNMIDAPLEIISSKVTGGSNITYNGAIYNTYAIDASSRIFPLEVKKLQLAAPSTTYDYANDNTGGTIDSRFSTETTYEKYDSKDNLTQMTERKGITTSYLYNKHDDEPAVVASGAAWDKIAYSGFENTVPMTYGGVWTLGGSFVTTDFATGKRCYTGTVSINTTGFPAVSYSLSFWMKGGANFTINNTAIPTPLNWTLYETRITAGGTITIVTQAGGLIDEVRLTPLDAQVATFSYDQLVGKNCMADSKSKPTFFEYDNLWRLHLIKDQNKDIIKRNNYEYGILAPLNYTLTATQTGGYTYQFTVAGGSAGYTYEWDFDDLTTPVSNTSTTMTHTFPSLTVKYLVKVKVKNSVNTLAILNKDLTVIAQSGGNGNLCNEIQNFTVNNTGTKQYAFNTASISGASYTWDFGDGTYAFTDPASHTYVTGIYNILLTVTAGGKSCSARRTLKVN